jgi:hypothetical protein
MWRTVHGSLHPSNDRTTEGRVSQWCFQNIFAEERLSEWAAIVGAHLGRIKGNSVFPTRVGMVRYRNRTMSK